MYLCETNSCQTSCLTRAIPKQCKQVVVFARVCDSLQHLRRYSGTHTCIYIYIYTRYTCIILHALLEQVSTELIASTSRTHPFQRHQRKHNEAKICPHIGEIMSNEDRETQRDVFSCRWRRVCWRSSASKISIIQCRGGTGPRFTNFFFYLVTGVIFQFSAVQVCTYGIWHGTFRDAICLLSGFATLLHSTTMAAKPPAEAIKRTVLCSKDVNHAVVPRTRSAVQTPLAPQEMKKLLFHVVSPRHGYCPTRRTRLT